ncbi:hypothetical protein SS50377_25878 [Spironucleus salmonicida]|uniref:Uncharacterized protein n=1 Tax=Spironucleus salmonicida TaxID=348837 RepID=V6LWY3_9EUKA|nr:hypothetical protein SS50377_25878 [Spironucleus salmonicida]|eukprot:EST48211.1 Hypothetical protein SS50377_11651 [Spironucleus salmonicida]
MPTQQWSQILLILKTPMRMQLSNLQLQNYQRMPLRKVLHSLLYYNLKSKINNSPNKRNQYSHKLQWYNLFLIKLKNKMDAVHAQWEHVHVQLALISSVLRQETLCGVCLVASE